jgi:hypothetical protein
MRDLVVAHRIEERRQLRGKLRKIEVTVGIDEHRWQGSGVRNQGSETAETSVAAHESAG